MLVYTDEGLVAAVVKFHCELARAFEVSCDTFATVVVLETFIHMGKMCFRMYVCGYVTLKSSAVALLVVNFFVSTATFVVV